MTTEPEDLPLRWHKATITLRVLGYHPDECQDELWWKLHCGSVEDVEIYVDKEDDEQ